MGWGLEISSSVGHAAYPNTPSMDKLAAIPSKTRYMKLRCHLGTVLIAGDGAWA